MGLRRLLFILAALLVLAGCSKEIEIPDNGGTADGERTVDIILTVPGLDVPASSRSMAGLKENEVSSIDVLVFSVSGNTRTFEYHQQGVNIENTYDQTNGYRAKFRVNLKVGNNKQIIVVANDTDPVSDCIAANQITTASTKSEVLALLQYPLYSKWSAAGVSDTDYTPIPMYGETSTVSITAGKNDFDISLVRMLARIDIKNRSTSDFTVEEVYLANYTVRGYMSPAWDANGVVAPAPVSAVNMEAATVSGWETQAGSYYTYSMATATPASGFSQVYLGEIYTFESRAAADANETARHNATCLIIKGIYGGVPDQSYYYRVDFTNTSGVYMPLLRNYLYNIDIQKAQDIGYGSIAEALASYTVKSNLHTRVVHCDLGVLKDIVSNGQNMLGVENQKMTFDWIGQPQSNFIYTDYNYSGNGWEIEAVTGTLGTPGQPSTYGTSVDWLSARKEEAPSAATNLIVEPEVNLSTTTGRNAYIYIRSGRLHHVVQVFQDMGQSVAPYVVSESNCYIVRPGSEMIFIPVSRANSTEVKTALGTVMDPIAAGAELGVKLVWTDHREGISGSGNVSYIKAVGTGSTGYIVVVPGSMDGNSVVAVTTKDEYDNDIIRWSWHIWNTDYEPGAGVTVAGVTWMDRNLGALRNTWRNMSDQADPTIGLYYQWGRKDPYPPVTDVYDADGNAINYSSTTVTSLEQTIQNPVYKAANTWTGSYGRYSWEKQTTDAKTVFDPCPEGWRVARGASWSGNWMDHTGLGKTYGGSVFFPASGYRSTSDIYGIGVNGYYWSSYSDGNSSRCLTYTIGSANATLATMSPRYQIPVRCIKN